MNEKIVFSAVKFFPEQKKLEKDKDGYYKCIMGMLNGFNRSGEFYFAEDTNMLINDENSILARRIRDGYLKGEQGHPSYVPGMTKADFVNRALKIDISNVSHHIRDVILTDTKKSSGVEGKGNSILVEGWIKPTGEKGSFLQAEIDDENMNTAFSIRCLTKDTRVGSVMIKKILQIVTWDWVIEPGIKTANKWDKLSMESTDICTLDLAKFDANGTIPNEILVSLESEDEKNILKQAIKNARCESSVCNFLRW